jgi:short-subunit dehydrogenase
MKKIAVITGASSGIGKSLAIKLKNYADEYKIDEFLLIGRDEKRLKGTAKFLNRESIIMPLDLTQDDVKKYAKFLESSKEDLEVVYLINAAGYGKFGKYNEIKLDATLGMIDLNCRALVAMTESTLPYMKEGGRIIEISSVASFQPLPKMNVYAASKSFVTFYGRALKRELKDRKISVTTVCPGWTDTAFFDRAQDTKNSKSVTNFAFMVTPDKVATKALKDADKRKDVSIITLPFKMQRLFTKFLPHRLAMWAFLLMQKEK